MYAIIPSATILGARGHEVSVEVSVSRQLPGFDLLGLPDAACRESRDRVRAALGACGVEWPTNQQVTVSLTPPSLPKTGAGLDLPIAIALLVAFEEVPADAVTGFAFVGELGLNGRIRRVPGVAPMVGVRNDCDWVVPAAALAEANAATSGRVRPVEHLRQLIDALTMVEPWPECEATDSGYVEPEYPDLADVRGQHQARLGLEVAAAGGHHLMFIGPPGSGKTMLSKRLPGLLPGLDAETALETTMIHSAVGNLLPNSGLITRPPFRAPHHTSSEAAMVGGGSHGLRPGEISLSHGGCLFLDEMGQFPPKVLNALREAFEQGYLMVGRVESERVPLPARFQLIGATNPCPCGGGRPGSCRCDERGRRRYLERLSKPFLDRFDLRIAVDRPETAELFDGEPGESSATVATRVRLVRDLAYERAGGLNAQVSDQVLGDIAKLESSAAARLQREVETDKLSARGYYRVVRVARTLADLAGEPDTTVADEFVAAAQTMRVQVGVELEGVAA